LSSPYCYCQPATGEHKVHPYLPGGHEARP
jgi:hypothetical protein